ncbi:hypothetical protein Droror1_Dr00020353 [Drosera rotundifolia]
MDCGNVIKAIEKDEAGDVTHLTGVLHLDGSVKTTKLKLTWLPESDELIKLSLLEFDYLITKKKLEKHELENNEEFDKVARPCTRKETLALGDSNMRNLKHGEIIQLERKGYFRCDVTYLRPSKPVVLFAIPDGRQQSVLRNTQVMDAETTSYSIGTMVLGSYLIHISVIYHISEWACIFLPPTLSCTTQLGWRTSLSHNHGR